jgi:short-chain fatty acids transporter
MDRITPDSFIFAVGLTFVVFLLGLSLAGKSPFEMTKYWAEGFWKFLPFTMQMVLVLTTGFTLATTPAGQRFLTTIARIPKSSVSATIFVLVVSAVLAWFSWGLGIICGSFLARELAKNLERVDFKLLVAATYTGSQTGILGLSFSEALLVNTPGHFLEKQIGLIPYSQTGLSPMMTIPLAITMVIVLPLLFWLIHPDEKDTPVLDDKLRAKFVDDSAVAVPPVQTDRSLAEIMDNSPVVNIGISAMGFTYIVYWFYTRGFDLNLDIFNFTLLFSGILLHGTPARLIAAFEQGVKASYGIVLQFPFYAGIQGMMGASGLVIIMAEWFTAISTPLTFPIWSYISAAFVNLFIPSAGGIFIIQGPIMIKAGMDMGVPAATIINSFAAGETLGNIIQPFWAIPLLGIAGVKMRDIMGFCMLAFFAASIVFLISFLVL